MKGLRSLLIPDEPPIEERQEPADLMPQRPRRREGDLSKNGAFSGLSEAKSLPNTGLPEAKTPHSLEAEKAVLSSILLEPRLALGLAADKLDTPHFFLPAHRTIFASMFHLWSSGKSVDLVTLTENLLAIGKMEHIGGPAYLAELQMYLPTGRNIAQYVDILLEKRAQRKLLELGEELCREVRSGGDIHELIDLARNRIAGIGTGKAQGKLPPLDDMSQLIGENLPATPPELVKGILHQGSKLIIGGTSKGMKTWTLTDLAVSVATGTDWWGCDTVQGKVCYINFEIQRPFFARRFAEICRAKGVTPAPGMFQCWTLRGLVDGIEKMAEDIIARLLEQNYSLIIFDPIYKALGNRDENKAGDVASMLNELEAIAVKTGAAIAFGAHFSKGNQAAKDTMDRIGGSGVFARDPDAIITMTPHSLEEHFTINTTLRNFPPQSPFVIRWGFPIFRRDDAADPEDLKQPKDKKKEERPGTDYTAEQIIEALQECGNSRKPSELARYLKEHSGMSDRTFWRLWNKAKDSPFLTFHKEDRRWIHVHNLR